MNGKDAEAGTRALTDTDVETMRGWMRQLAEAAGGGALDVHILMPEDWGVVFDAYMASDALAGRLAECVMEMTAGQRRAQGREPHLCACRHRSLEAPTHTIDVITTTEEQPAPTLTIGICLSCAPDREAAQHRIAPRLVQPLNMMRRQESCHLHANGSE